MCHNSVKLVIKQWRKNLITICTLVQYAPQTLTGNLWENVSLAVQYAPDLCINTGTD